MPNTNKCPLIVGVGASAGGLEAIQALLAALGNASRLAVVLVQHGEANAQAIVVEVVRSATPLPVIALDSSTQLQPGVVYIGPSQSLLSLEKGTVHIEKPAGHELPVNPIDHFFHTLAEDQGERGVGAILSGSGSDGTLGLKAISDRGGLTFAQAPMSAKFDSMPRSAATTGLADHIIEPAAIAAELLQYSQHLADTEVPAAGLRKQTDIEEAIPRIARRLAEVTQHNFQHYKPNTLTRRIQRRMQVLKLATAAEYLDHLQHHEDEVRALFRELLIGVTSFFRDPDAFDALKRHVLPKLFENRKPADCVRIWVAGCANGAEAYTLAILCRELIDEENAPPCEVQIFATDIDERALAIARAGVYPVGIKDQVSPERLKRFFVKRGNKFHVTKEIREMVLFSVHNLISDPPFSQQDLISCRNLLIYLGPHLQNKLIPLFHYALRPSGYLFLGPSENIASHGELFRPLDAKHRVSQRKGTAIGASGAGQYRPSPERTPHGGQLSPDTGIDLTEIRQRITLDEFSPKSVVIDEGGQILNASDGMQKYLTVSGGDDQNNIIKMAARGLRVGLLAAIAEAKRSMRRVDHEDLSIRIGDQVQRVMITVQPMPQLGEDDALFMVVFHDVGKPFKREDVGEPTGSEIRRQLRQGDESDESKVSATFASRKTVGDIVEQLERELETTRDDLDKTLQDMESANEELKSSNEELRSMNEELQSANEELETSREEIRCSSDATARANADLENLLRSTQIATVFLDDQLLIRSFTPAIQEIYSLIRSDVGRPLERFVSNVDGMPPLPNPRSLADGESVEHTVMARSGKSFIRRVLPYRSHTGKSEGIVVTFTDVSELRKSEERFRATFENAAVGIAHIGLDGSWLCVNDRLCQIVGHDRDVLLQKTFQDITHPDDLNRDIQQLHALITGETNAYTSEKRTIRSNGEVIWIRLTISVKRDVAGQPEYFISIIEDIDKAKRGELELSDAKARLELSLEVANIAPWNWDMKTGDVVSNPTLNRLFGFDSDATPRLSDFLAKIEPAAKARVSAAVECSTKTGKIFEEEYSINWPSGEVRHIRARGEVRMSSAGEMEDFFGVVVDITDRKRRELDFMDRAEYLRRVIDNTTNFIAVYEPDGTVLDVNQPAVQATGLERETMIGVKFWDFECWDYDPEIARSVKAGLLRSATGEPVRFDSEFLAADGSRRMVDMSFSPVKDSAGTVIFVIGCGIDISARVAAEATMRESEQLVRTMAENSTQAMIMMDDRGYLTYCNQTFLEMVGFDDVEIRSKPLHDLIHHHYPNGRPYPMSECPIDRALPEDFSVRAHEDLFFRKDGSSFPVMCAASPVFRDGKPVSTVIEVRDVTEQKRWEQEITGREAHLRRVINNQLGLVGLIDRDGTLLEVDDDSMRIAGVSREDVIGKHFAECAWWTYDDAVAQKMRETMERAFAGEIVRFDVPLYGAGLGRPEDRLMIDFMMAPVFDDNGNVEYLIPSGVDSSERHAAQLAQQESEQQLRIGMEVAQFGIAFIDYRTETVRLSKEAAALYGLGDNGLSVARCDLHRLIHRDDQAEINGAIQACMAGNNNGLLACTHRIVLPDGGIRWVDVRKQMFFDEFTNPPTPTHAILAARDVTERSEFEQSLTEARELAVAANESKSAFLANMSHEIRTPMTAILGYADLIRDKIEAPEAIGYLQTIRRNGVYLLEIINDILDLSKIEAGKVDLHQERFDPTTVVEDVRSIMEVRARDEGLNLSVEYGMIPATIYSDSKRVKQILINLVGNAIKFTEEGEVKIVVELAKNSDVAGGADSLQFRVIDTGIGISDQQRDNLFTPFSQGDSSVSRNFGGTGLGLAISQRLTEMLGGKISVESKIGQGSTFTTSIATGDLSGVELVQPEQVALQSIDPTSADSIRLSCHVLIVDDRRDIRFLSKHILTKASATVEEVEDGRLAVEHIRSCLDKQNEPDLVLLDMQMPNLDGYETARQLRALGYAGPIIALTADAMQGDMNRCLASGCNDYLSKPIDSTRLVALVRYCRHFGVDWRCAAVELSMLGVKIDPAYLVMREATEAGKARQRMGQKNREKAKENAHWHPYTDPYAAYLAGDFEALFDLEQAQAVNEDDAVDRLDVPF